MPGKAARVMITERQQEILLEFANARTVQVSLAKRARIILLAFERRQNEEISTIVDLNSDQVGLWRRRWQQAWQRLIRVECASPLHELKQAICEVLADRPRSGRPRRIGPDQQAQLVSLACELPEASGRPVSHWSARELADELADRGIVDSISPRWVNQLLRRAALRPHRSKYWLFSPDRRDPVFQQRVALICEAYQEAPTLYEQQGIHTICIDEQTGIQALERIAADLPPRPGQIARCEYEYRRHGTIGLFGNLHVATGEVIAPLLRETRTEEDFVENLDNIICTDPAAGFRLIVDNLNTHASASCVRYVAYCCGIEDDLGVKGRRGILKSVHSRMEFLSDATHRIRFLYLPRHTSWMNQIEIWFGVLRRKLTRRGSFASLEELRERIIRFIDYYNNTMAHPYRWTYNGTVLAS